MNDLAKWLLDKADLLEKAEPFYENDEFREEAADEIVKFREIADVLNARDELADLVRRYILVEKELRELLVAHHAVGVLADGLVGDDCPVCAERDL